MSISLRRLVLDDMDRAAFILRTSLRAWIATPSARDDNASYKSDFRWSQN